MYSLEYVLGERVGSGFEREFDAEEGLADRWSSAVVRTNGSVEVVPDYGYRTVERGKVEVFFLLCVASEECERASGETSIGSTSTFCAAGERERAADKVMEDPALRPEL